MEMQSLVNEANLIPLHDMMFDTHVPGDDEEFWHTIYNNIAKIAPELASHIRSKKLKSYAVNQKKGGGIVSLNTLP